MVVLTCLVALAGGGCTYVSRCSGRWWLGPVLRLNILVLTEGAHCRAFHPIESTSVVSCSMSY